MIPTIILPDIIIKTSFWQKLVLKVIAEEPGVSYDTKGNIIKYGYNPELKGNLLYLNPWVLVDEVDEKKINFFVYVQKDWKIFGVTEIVKELEKKVDDFLDNPENHRELCSLLDDGQEIRITYKYTYR